MAKKLTWDSPGLTWNAPGLTWDGEVADLKPMSKVKAIIDFSGYAGPALGPVAQTIHDQTTAHAAAFPAPPVTMPALQTLITTFLAKLTAKASRATADTIAFNVARHAIEVVLGDLGGYVNQVAKGDPAIVVLSGFPSYETGHPADAGPPAGPANVVLRQGDLSGEFVARYRPARSHSMNEVQTCTGDPNVEANWVHKGMFSGGKATIGGIAPGTTVWARIRTAGLHGVMGSWSDPAKLIVV